MPRSTKQSAVTERQPGGQHAPRHDATSHDATSLQRFRGSRAAVASFRVLYVDDEPDIREVVELSLTLDPAFAVRSCASGGEALAAAVEWLPDLILCDVMMPVMDGPTTLARLRENPQTAHIPVVFMTARAQTRELEHFKSLGAVGVIPKPFDPMTLASSMRGHLRTASLSALRDGFMKRLRSDATALAHYRADLADAGACAAALEQIKTFAHALSGAAGIFGFREISRAAAELENTMYEQPYAERARVEIEQKLDALLRCIEGAPNEMS